MTQLYLQPLLADAFGDLQTGLGQALKLLMMFGFIFGVVLIMKGAYDIRRGEDGKGAIIGGILIAAAPAIMYALFSIFMKNGATPTF